jgi:hemerythrin
VSEWLLACLICLLKAVGLPDEVLPGRVLAHKLGSVPPDLLGRTESYLRFVIEAEMNETLHAAPAKIGEQHIDNEHDLQMQMLDSLAESLQKGGDFSPARYILEQFIEFSDMHFLSEQLVMRLHSYPGYEAHLEAHTQLMKKVREIRDSVLRGENAPSLQLVQQLRDWLLHHIASEDVAFGEFLRTKEVRGH